MTSVNGKRASTLTRNTVAQTAPVLLGYLASFISGPIIVGALGLRAFGIWALTGALAQYGSLLDLGVGRSVSRFIALHDDNERKVAEYMGAGFVSVLVVTLGVFVAALWGAETVARAVGHISTSEMRTLLLSSAVILATAMAGRLVTSYPIGLRRMTAPNLALAIGVVLNFLFTIGSLILGANLVQYAEANAVASLLSLVVVVVVVWRAEHGIPLSVPPAPRIRELLAFSVKNQTTWLADLVNFQSDKVVIAVVVGPAAAGAYELANRVAGAARALGLYTVSALVPTITARARSATVTELGSAYERLLRISVSLSTPVLVFAAAASPLLLGAWLGHVPPYTVLVLVGLCAAYVPNVSGAVSYTFANAIGRPGLPAVTAVGTALANVALTVALAPLFGVWGVLAGTVIALAGGAFTQVCLVQPHLGVPINDYLRPFGAVSFAAIAFSLPIAAISATGMFSSRAAQAVAVVVCGIIYFAAYLRWAGVKGMLPQALQRLLVRTRIQGAAKIARTAY